MTKTKYAVDAATRRIRFKRKLKLNLWCWMFMSLAVGFYILFQGYPIICSIQYSLLDWSGMTSNATFIGLQNYKELMHDELFWNAFINSFLWCPQTPQGRGMTWELPEWYWQENCRSRKFGRFGRIFRRSWRSRPLSTEPCA